MNKVSGTSLRTKKFKVLHDALKYVNIPFSTKYNALYDLKDASLVLLHMCKTGSTANKAVADLSVMLKDDKNICNPDISVTVRDDKCNRFRQDGHPVQTHVK